jgi:ribosomal protein L34
MATKPIKPMTLSAKQRHSLAVAPPGPTVRRKRLTAHGFSIRMALVKHGVVTIAREKVRLGPMRNWRATLGRADEV